MNLKDQIAARIRANGPMPLADYMAECLLHPAFGYYATREPFGTNGDFVTAPEVSQMFGELIGLSLAQAWLDQGSPSVFTLAELGPGRGTLMADLLRAAASVKGFLEAARITLIEASPRLQELQRETLKGYQLTFAEHVTELPEQPLFFVANEFFDALPIRQFERRTSAWCERLVGLDRDRLVIGLGPETDVPALSDRLPDTREGDVVEYAPQAAPIVDALTMRIAMHGGAGLIVDYGDWRSLGDTLQAVKAHRYTDVLDTPGACDLTAHVDFEVIARAARCAHTKLTPQGVFLERLGITQRARALAGQLHGEPLDRHIRAHWRLTHPDEMGNLFKVFGLFAAGHPPPPGLEQ
ncbi:MAG: SAM-dependent methyltransferase [Roseobacter sp.]|jgi:SAM-dependent MidA family methyltransferase|nr:SAM-dependent methyltransferase [Roseobacter sp.]